MRNLNIGTMVISLDFELLWGVFDKVNWEDKVKYFQNTKIVVPEILSLFQEYEIACTWATVGMLFNEDWDEWNHNIPNSLPNYTNTKLSAYKYGKSIQSKATESICFAPELIKEIISTDRQEMASHTYSHYYCRENGQNSENFKSDLITAKKIARKFEINLQSLVFPRNQINADYLQVCRELEISSVRSNPSSWYWKNTENDTLKQKVFRTGDAYVGKNDKSYSYPEINSIHHLSIQPASRMLRPYSNNSFLNRLKLKRIINEMSFAAKNGLVYHLWWHPHNFGNDLTHNLQDLIKILEHYKKCKEEYNFQSCTMNELNTF
jgi:hypothetical protein